MIEVIEAYLWPLEDVVARLTDINTPDYSPENLSQIAFRYRQEMEKSTDYDVKKLHPYFFFGYFYLRSKGVSKFELKKGELWHNALRYFHKPAWKSKETTIEQRVSAETCHNLWIGSEKDQSERESRFNASSEFYHDLDRFKKKIHCPTVGLLPTTVKLKYHPWGEKSNIFILPEVEREIIRKEEESRDSEMAKDRYYQVLSQFNLHQPNITEFPAYNYTDDSTLTNTFIKWVNPTRVDTVDHEIAVAQELHQRSFHATTFYGYVLRGDNAYLVGRKIKGVDFTAIFYSRNVGALLPTVGQSFNPYDPPDYVGNFIHKLNKNYKIITPQLWKAKVAEAYQLLGSEVRRLFDTDIYYPDLALRNVKLSYVNKKPRITFMDFERAEIRSATAHEQREILHSLDQQFKCRSFEQQCFYQGFKQ